jgi:hypothetical protein
MGYQRETLLMTAQALPANLRLIGRRVEDLLDCFMRSWRLQMQPAGGADDAK